MFGLRVDLSILQDVRGASPQAASLSLKRSQTTYRGMCYLLLVLVHLGNRVVLCRWEDTFMVQSYLAIRCNR